MASASTDPPCCPLVHQNTGCSVLKDEVGVWAGQGGGAGCERCSLRGAALQVDCRRDC